MTDLLLEWLYVFVPAVLGGLCQATTGFGSAIVMLLFYPSFIPLLQASTLTTVVGLFNNLALAWQFRAHIRVRQSGTPFLFYLALGTAALQLARRMDTDGLKLVFGLFLVALALYFMFASKSVRVRPTLGAAAVCGSLSGVLSGMFGIGGPPMVVYFLGIAEDDKEYYIANIQFFFLCCSVYMIGLRAFSGLITPALLLQTIPGTAGILAGKAIGVRIMQRIDIALMRRIVYAVMALSGVTTVLSCL